jgi:hypothetical protein
MAAAVGLSSAAPDEKLPVALFQTYVATGTNVIGNKVAVRSVARWTFPAQYRSRKSQRANRRVDQLDEDAQVGR